MLTVHRVYNTPRPQFTASVRLLYTPKTTVHRRDYSTVPWLQYSVGLQYSDYSTAPWLQYSAVTTVHQRDYSTAPWLQYSDYSTAPWLQYSAVTTVHQRDYSTAPWQQYSAVTTVHQRDYSTVPWLQCISVTTVHFIYDYSTPYMTTAHSILWPVEILVQKSALNSDLFKVSNSAILHDLCRCGQYSLQSPTTLIKYIYNSITGVNIEELLIKQ